MPADEAPSEQIRRADERLHVLDAIAAALADPHRVLDLILAAPDGDAATTALERAFGFDAIQASAVASLQFRHATTRGRTALDTDRRETQAALDDLRSRSRTDE